MLTKLGGNGLHANAVGNKGRGDRACGGNPQQVKVGVRVGFECGHLTIARGVFGNAWVAHGIHHGTQVNGGSGPELGLHGTAGVALLFNTVDFSYVKSLTAVGAVPALFNGKVDEVSRGHEVVAVFKI